MNDFMNSKGLPILLALILGCVFLYATDFSVSGFIADQVIEKMDAKYSPYGPDVPNPK